MRIISGNFKGKKIVQPNDNRTRPLKDLTKESIFNIISHSKKFHISLDKSIVLDLFSGVGSFGLECLSRGVRNVYFVENYSGVLPILKKNLANLKSVSNFEIIEKDIYNENLKPYFKSKFNIIFLDPPYKDKNLNTLLEKIRYLNILEQNGVIILHRHKNQNDIFSPEFKIIEEKNYGISKIIFGSF